MAGPGSRRDDRCAPNPPTGEAWTNVRVRELREQLGSRHSIRQPTETISADETASRLVICVGSVQKLIREGVLPATQLLP